MTYKRPLLVIGILVTLVAAGYLLTTRSGFAVQKKMTNRKGPRTLPPSVESEVEGLTITNVRFEYGDEMTAYDIVNSTDKAVLSVVVRAAASALTADADPGTVLIPPGGLHMGRMITDDIKDDTPLVLSAATFEGEEAKGTPEDVRRMGEYRREKRERMRQEKDPPKGS